MCMCVCVFVPNEDVQPQNEVWGDGGGPNCLALGADGLGAEYVNLCPSCPPAPSLLCTLAQDLR